MEILLFFCLVKFGMVGRGYVMNVGRGFVMNVGRGYVIHNHHSVGRSVGR